MIIDKYLEELDNLGFTTEEINIIKEKMLSYAFDACIDSKVQQEVMLNLYYLYVGQSRPEFRTMVSR